MKVEKYNRMIIIRNNLIPFPGYKCINLFGILFAKPNANIDETTLNHESIHTALIKEMLYIFFYIWYLIEWIIRLIIQGSMAYHYLGFEKEAYTNQNNKDYLSSRPYWSWFKYLF